MKYKDAKTVIEASYALIGVKPTDRLDFLDKAIKVEQVILRCITFLDSLKGSPYLGEYSEDDLAHIHEAFCESATPLVQMMEHFLEKAESDADRYSFAV